MIKLEHIDAGYGNKRVLHSINLSFPERQITSIIGRNGCGKSTLLKVMGGFIKPDKGDIILDGVNLFSMENGERARKMSYLPQSRSIPMISVEKMVLHGRFPYLSYPRRYRKEDKRIALEAMERVGIFHLRERELSRLSGGERQKVYLAMGLTQSTDVILLDEPTTFLDITYQLEVLKLLSELREEGKTIITVIHDIDLALRYSDQILVMKEGQVVLYDKPQKVYESGVLQEVFHVKPCLVLDKDKEVYYFTQL